MNKALQLRWNDGAKRIFLLTIFGLYALLFLPFWKEMILGFLFACACAPAIRFLRARLATRSNTIGYWVVAGAVTLLIAIVAIAAFQLYGVTYEIVSNNDRISEYNTQLTNLRDSFLRWVSQQEYLGKFGTKQKIDQVVLTASESGRNLALSAGRNFISAAPDILGSFAIFLGAFAAFLVIGDGIWKNARQVFKLKPTSQQHFLQFERICGIAMGSVVLIGTVQSVLISVGAIAAGWGGVFPIFVGTFIFSLIPILGAGLMGAILAVISLVQGDISGAIILGIAAGIAGVADNILRAWLFSRAAKTNPIISLISLFGGIALFGFAGLFIAPVIEQLAMTYVVGDRGRGEPPSVEVGSDAGPAGSSSSSEIIIQAS